MKNLALVCSALYALSISVDSFAQTRGSRYNPPSRGSSSSPSRSSSSPSRGSSYSPPSRPSSSSSSSPSRGSSYRPPSRPSYSSSSRGSSSSSSSRSSSSSSRGSNYNPPSSGSNPSYSSSTARGPRYNPSGSTSNVPRGPRYNPPVSHRPVVVTHGPRYNNPRAYYTYVPSYYIYRRWVQYPVHYWYYDGYWEIDGYPYYVSRGYRYRYSQVDMCQYELVDANDYTTVKKFPVQACSVAFDNCAIERDALNRLVSMERYFCAEAVDDDQVVADVSSYRPSAVEMSEQRRAEIKAYLAGMNYKAIFKDGYKGGVGSCSIKKLKQRNNPYNCLYQINVKSKSYPAVDGSVCSAPSQAELVACNVGKQKTNAGCILKQAIESGYCL